MGYKIWKGSNTRGTQVLQRWKGHVPCVPQGDCAYGSHKELAATVSELLSYPLDVFTPFTHRVVARDFNQKQIKVGHVRR